VKKPVVLLHHGVTLASDCFVVLNANESLGFILADAGGLDMAVVGAGSGQRAAGSGQRAAGSGQRASFQ
jgi:hypothetical protein